MITILLVDDHPGFRGALAGLLGLEEDLKVCGQAADGYAAVTTAAHTRPDVIMMDLGLPGMDGLAATRAILRADAYSRVVVLTSSGDVEVHREALEAGARGLLVKGCPHEQIVDKVREIAAC